MNERVSMVKKKFGIKYIRILPILVWSAILAGSMGWNYYHIQILAGRMAKREATKAIQKDLNFRLWNTNHGGVYVPITRQTQPNPYLSVTNREVETLSGQSLTLINPAFMTRQVHELEFEKYGIRGHLTSLKPIRLQNAPDAWEKNALQSFEKGSKDAIDRVLLEDEPFLRFMRPLVTVEGCMKCHEEQGYIIGDIRGGISVSIPMKPYLSEARNHMRFLAMGHLLIWVLGIFGLVFGIKRLEKYDKKLLEGKKRLEIMFESMQNGLILIDAQTHIILDANPAACKLINASRQKIVGSLCHRFLCPKEEGNCPITDLQQTIDNSEKVLLKSDGSRINILKTVVSVTIDNRPCLLESFVDISTQKYMEEEMKNLLTELKNQNVQLQTKSEALKVSEKKFRTIFNSFQDLYFRCNMNGIFEIVSPSVKLLSGYEEDELIGKSVLKAFVRESDQKNLMTDLLTDGKINNHVLELKKKNKEITTVSLNVQIITNNNNDPIAIEGVMRDISERKKDQKSLKKRVEELNRTRFAMLNMIEDLEEAREDAEKAAQIKSDFLANMSHEIRTPLNAVLGFLELVLEDHSLSKFQQKHLTTAQTSANSLLGLINDILDISKLESGKLTIEQHPFSLFRLMQEIHETMDINAREKGLNLQLDIQPSLSGTFMGDPLRLRQIMINLVGNAVKFTREGHVCMKVVPAETDNQLHFIIEDTGVGIPADRLRQIFEPFTQADTSTTRKFGGTGLGTTIARELVELMEGRIWAESEEGKGSIFHFIINLPLTDQDLDNTDLFVVPGKAVLPAFRRSFKTLLVEDIEANVDLAKIRLEQQGHEVIVAGDGREAVEIFEQGDIDLILMDIQMPVMSGTEATECIRALEAGAGGHVPIIAMTAGVMREETAKYLEKGMDAVVAKPINFSKLFETMKKVVPEGVGTAVSEDKMNGSVSSGLELPLLDGVDIKKGIETWKNPEVYAKALLRFSRDYGNTAADLNHLIDKGDIDSVYPIVHTLKGLAGNLFIIQVADVATRIDTDLKGKQMDNVKNHLFTLAEVLNTAVDSIRQLEAMQDIEDTPKKEMDLPYLKGLFIKMLAGLDQFSPYTIEPFLSELKEYLTHDQLNLIENYVDRFDFDGAKEETIKLAKMLKIGLEE